MPSIAKQSFNYYINSFRGFSKEVWWLALVTLVNRAGAMVLPFLSLYLSTQLDFSLSQVGWIMSCFGFGSLFGSWLGGEATHKIGAYRTMIISLVLSGLFLIALGFVDGFWMFCLWMFLTALVSDLFRPAVFVALTAYAVPENRTRAVTLIRLAINLGFSLGPALGGLLIVMSGYSALFWIDGSTCVLAGLLILFGLREKRAAKKSEDKVDTRHSHKRILSDTRYMLFLSGVFLFSMLFVQYFSAMPIYYKTIHLLTEDEVGWLLSINGFLVFLVEMPIIFALDKPKFSVFQLIMIGSLMLAMSFGILLITGWAGILLVGMVFATFAEILCFPFTNTYAMKRGGAGNEGRYMAYYSMTFSLAHIVGHNFGMQVSGALGFTSLLSIMTLLSLLSGVIFWWVGRKENEI